MFVFAVAGGLDFFKGRAKLCFHLIQKGGTKSIPQKRVVKMTYIAPEAVITVAAFRNKAVNVGIPFEIPAKGMEDHDKAGGKVQGFILLEKQAGNNAVYRMEKTVKE